MFQVDPEADEQKSLRTERVIEKTTKANNFDRASYGLIKL